jgi:uncharacterized membrane-anchored protein
MVKKVAKVHIFFMSLRVIATVQGMIAQLVQILMLEVLGHYIRVAVMKTILAYGLHGCKWI